MFTNTILAAGAFVAMVAAVPMADQHHHHHMHQHGQHKRDYVWVTHTEEVVETVAVTKTVWVEPGQTPVQPAGFEHHSRPAPPAFTPPAPVETPSSVYVAPAPSTTSVYVAPTPTTPAYVAPIPSTTSVYVAPAPTTPAYVAPTTAAAPAPAPSSGSGGGSGPSSGMAASGTSFSGDLTWYAVGLGACGITNVASDHVVAISETIFDSYSTGNPNTNPLCGKSVTITGADGSPYVAKIVDRCTGCAEADLDLSEDFFNTVTNNGDGRVHNMKWVVD